MKKEKKKLLILFSSCAFVALMMFNVSVSMDANSSLSDLSLHQIELMGYANAETNDPWGPDCTSGYCVQLCGYQMFLTACTYIDCGSGTQLCTRLRRSPYP